MTVRKSGAVFIIGSVAGLAAAELSGSQLVDPAKVPAYDPMPVVPYLSVLIVVFIGVAVVGAMGLGLHDQRSGSQ